MPNGEILRLAPGPADHRRCAGRPPVPRRPPAGPAREGPVRERRKLAFVGIVVGRLAMSRNGEVLGDPRSRSTAFRPQTPTATTCSTSCSMRSKARCDRSREKDRKNPEMVAEAVRRAVRAAVNEAWGKKPIFKVLVNVVDTKG